MYNIIMQSFVSGDDGCIIGYACDSVAGVSGCEGCISLFSSL